MCAVDSSSSGPLSCLTGVVLPDLLLRPDGAPAPDAGYRGAEGPQLPWQLPEAAAAPVSARGTAHRCTCLRRACARGMAQAESVNRPVSER